MDGTMRRACLAGCLVLPLLAACPGSGGGTTDPGVADVAPDPGTADVAIPDAPPVDLGDVPLQPDVQSFLAQYQATLDQSVDMTPEALRAKWYQARPYVDAMPYDATQADGLDRILAAYPLTDGQRATLAKQGFVIARQHPFESHPLGYLDVFRADLPVLVTTDSILFALHKSYDLMLQQVEETRLIPALDALLAAIHERFAGVPLSQAAVSMDAWQDVDLYLSVARSLLKGEPVAPHFPNQVAARDALLAQIEALQPRQVVLFGRAYPCDDPMCAYDFSQFKPRGHYTLSEALQRYFRAMIWLGRTEMLPTRFQRDLLAVCWLTQATVDAGQMPTWQGVDRVIQVFVGASDNLTMPEVVSEFPAGYAQMLPGDPILCLDLMQKIAASGLGQQRIASQILAVDPLSPDPTPLPPSFQFLGQRYVIDSHVFSNVVYDRITWQGDKPERFMPSPLDPMFVLGFQEALPLLQDELDAWHYAGNLNVLRTLVEAHDGAFWGESMYNLWLDAIRSLAADTTGAGYPDAAKTLAYARKSMHAGLASWAELRHDTILYVKQSYTGEGCDYPDGYVEPFPAFFHRLESFAAGARALLAATTLPYQGQDHPLNLGSEWFDAMQSAAAMLAGIAEREIANEPRTPEQTAFLRSLVQDEGVCGGPEFSGWYADLFYGVTDQTFEFKPTVADVHTDPNSTNVLHVATGHPDLMVFLANTSCGLKAYAGPASSYYEDLEPNYTRLTDEEWKNRLDAGPEPDRPAWTATFVQ
jgi:hypothetical protein